MSDLETDLKYDERFPARRKLVWFLIISFSLFALVFSIVEIENWRGRSAWKKYQREAEAKGETFDIRKLAPPEIPNDSNFAGVPMFAKMFDYYRDAAGKAVWRDTNAMNMDPFRREATESDIDSPETGYWVVGRKVNLTEWQTYYQKVKQENSSGTKRNKVNNFPVPDEPGNPGEDVLLALSKCDEAVVQLREAASRPFSRFPIEYESHNMALLPHLVHLKQATQLLQLRASAHLGAGQIENAADDVMLNLRVANSLRGEPLLISHLVRIAMETIALHPLWEGLDEQQWSDAQLDGFQKELQKFDFLEANQKALRGERALAVMITGMLRTNRAALVDVTVGYSGTGSIKDQIKQRLYSAPIYMIPDGWLYQNQLAICRMYELVLPSVDPASHRVFRDQIKNTKKVEEELYQGFRPYKMLVTLLFVAVTKSVEKTAFQQAAIDQAILACALERYRLANGSFPETLFELAPRFIEKIPHDIMNGEPLKYRRTTDGKFILYSVGWNETDDGGIVALTSTGKGTRREEGDWVWQYSTNPPASQSTESEGIDLR